MAGFSKRFAVLALAAAAACSDSFPPQPGPLDRFYFPVGLAARRLPAGNTALLVVSSNFDLRYDFDVGGAVVAVDPDASGDALAGDPRLAVLGGVNIGSFGGEVDYLAGSGPGWPYDDLAHACAPLASQLPAGGAKVVATSRGKQVIYDIAMDATGALTCDGCAVPVRPAAYDPYGVTSVCAELGGVVKAAAYVTHLRSTGNEGWVTELDLRSGVRSDIDMGPGSTYTSTAVVRSTFASPPPDMPAARLFVSTRLLTVSSDPLRWFDPLEVQPGVSLTIDTHDVATVVTGALTRKMAISSDGTRGYLMLDLFDYDLALSSASFVPTGSALAVYDITESAYAQPTMQLLRFVPTCVGSGELKVMKRDNNLRDVVAITCDAEGALLFYDDQLGAVVHRIGLDPVTGVPRLGRQPFGMAMEPRAAGTCSAAFAAVYGQVACTRLYVASFDRSWVNLVELEPDDPEGAMVVKRIGMERD